MRFVTLIASVLLLASAFLCYAGKKPKVTYEFPADMAEPVRAEFKKQCDKGFILYQLNCAPCHNRIEKGKIIIPDFTPDQIKGYEMRVANERHQTELPDEKVTEEELGLISTFLMYKKKNG